MLPFSFMGTNDENLTALALGGLVIMFCETRWFDYLFHIKYITFNGSEHCQNITIIANGPIDWY